jgi:hypothetical protein
MINNCEQGFKSIIRREGKTLLKITTSRSAIDVDLN